MTRQELITKTGSEQVAKQVCKRAIIDLKLRLSLLTVSYHKIEQYNNEIIEWSNLSKTF